MEVVFFQEENGSCPVLNYLRKQTQRTRAKARDRINLLAESGHKLRRPYVDYVEAKIYELRWRSDGVNHRIMYAFSGKVVIVLLHALVKTKVIPRADIKRASERRILFESDQASYTYRPPGSK